MKAIRKEMNGMEGKICYGVLGVQRRFETKAQAIVYAKLLKLPYSSVYLILPPDITQKMIDRKKKNETKAISV